MKRIVIQLLRQLEVEMSVICKLTSSSLSMGMDRSYILNPKS